MKAVTEATLPPEPATGLEGMPTNDAGSPRIAAFFDLTKPRMNFLVVLTTLIGFCAASVGGIRWILLLHTMIGTALCAGGAAVLNMLMERVPDGLMRRTRRRPIPSGRISPAEAGVFGLVLCVAGVVWLASAVNPLTSVLGLATILIYLLLYTPLKRITPANTIVGAVPGAIPPVMGVTAATGVITPEALALFAILFLWQIPHFLAIAMLYREDYAAGGFRMLPVVDGDLSATARAMVAWTAALVPASLLPWLVSGTGILYAAIASALGAAFLGLAVQCARTRSTVDARRLFLGSIVYLPLILAALLLDRAR
jgi:protoheme IX farnesyltransferase